MPSGHQQQCAFIGADGKPCEDTVLRKDKFCIKHLEALTRDNVKNKIIDIVCQELGTDRTEVSVQSKFVEDLGADSLDKITLVVRMEEEFPLIIPDERADEMFTVGDLTQYVIDVLLAVRTFMPEPDIVTATITTNMARKAQHTERILNQILKSDLFQKYYEMLNLEPDKLGRIIHQVVRDDRIYNVTSIPEPPTERADCVHVLLLGKAKIYYFKLQQGFMRFEWAALNDLRLTYEMFLNENTDVSKIIVKSSSRDMSGSKRKIARSSQKGTHGCVRQESLRDATFKFEGNEIGDALEFLAQYLTNIEGGGEQQSNEASDFTKGNHSEGFRS